MSNRREEQEKRQQLLQKVADDEHKRSLAKHLLRKHKDGESAFTVDQIAAWGKENVGKRFVGEKLWLQEFFALGFISLIAESESADFELTEDGVDFAEYIILNEKRVITEILGEPKLTRRGGEVDDSTIFEARGSRSEGTGKVKTNRFQPDGWTANHIDD